MPAAVSVSPAAAPATVLERVLLARLNPLDGLAFEFADDDQLD